MPGTGLNKLKTLECPQCGGSIHYDRLEAFYRCDANRNHVFFSRDELSIKEDAPRGWYNNNSSGLTEESLNE